VAQEQAGMIKMMDAADEAFALLSGPVQFTKLKDESRILLVQDTFGKVSKELKSHWFNQKIYACLPNCPFCLAYKTIFKRSIKNSSENLKFARDLKIRTHNIYPIWDFDTQEYSAVDIPKMLMSKLMENQDKLDRETIISKFRIGTMPYIEYSLEFGNIVEKDPAPFSIDSIGDTIGIKDYNRSQIMQDILREIQP